MTLALQIFIWLDHLVFPLSHHRPQSMAAIHRHLVHPIAAQRVHQAVDPEHVLDPGLDPRSEDGRTGIRVRQQGTRDVREEADASHRVHAG